MLPRILTLSTCVSACPAKCICVSLPEDFLWLVPSLPTMWSLGELPPLPGSVPLLGPAVCCGWLLPLVPTVCEGWLRASFPKVISVKSAKEGVFTPWKWANTTHQGFFFFFFFLDSPSLQANQDMTGCVSARVFLQDSALVVQSGNVLDGSPSTPCPPSPVLLPPPCFLFLPNEPPAFAFLSQGLFLRKSKRRHTINKWWSQI